MKLCVWSIGLGRHAFMLQTLVKSYRDVGMPHDFYAIASLDIDGATTIPHSPLFESDGFFFKYHLLRDVISKLDYDLFVFLDADMLFMRRPDDFEQWAEEGGAAAAILMGDCSNPEYANRLWWDYPVGRFAALCQRRGLPRPNVWYAGGGIWSCRRDFINQFCDECHAFREEARRDGWEKMTEEAPLSYVVQRYGTNPEAMLASNHPRLYACLQEKITDAKLPRPKPVRWTFLLTDEYVDADPAILHVFKNKEILVREGWRIKGMPGGGR